MCKLKRYNGRSSNPKIDECMIKLVENLSWFGVPTIACCCGHGKYPMTLIVKGKDWNHPQEIFSGKFIKRKSRFYKKDRQGYYYIPETVLPTKHNSRLKTLKRL